MKKHLLLVSCCIISSCAGLAVGEFGAAERAFDPDGKYLGQDPEEFISHYGAPDNEYFYKECKVLEYTEEDAIWSGYYIHLLILPLAIGIPADTEKTKYYFHNNQYVGESISKTTHTDGAGAVCEVIITNDCGYASRGRNPYTPRSPSPILDIDELCDANKSLNTDAQKTRAR